MVFCLLFFEELNDVVFGVFDVEGLLFVCGFDDWKEDFGIVFFECVKCFV